MVLGDKSDLKRANQVARLNHELSHYFDDQGGKPYDGEAGDDFEIAVYKQLVEDYGDAQRLKAVILGCD